MKKILQRGFTLIELLVVIAIIGILAAVVLASLNDARTSGSNAAIQQTINNVRSQAEIYYNSVTPVSYTGACINGDVARLVQSVIDANSSITSSSTALATPSSASNIACHEAANGTAYALSSPLVDTGAGQTFYCVDSDGNAGVSGDPLAASAVTCP